MVETLDLYTSLVIFAELARNCLVLIFQNYHVQFENVIPQNILIFEIFEQKIVFNMNFFFSKCFYQSFANFHHWRLAGCNNKTSPYFGQNQVLNVNYKKENWLRLVQRSDKFVYCLLNTKILYNWRCLFLFHCNNKTSTHINLAYHTRYSIICYIITI